jgi:hypothetical protein
VPRTFERLEPGRQRPGCVSQTDALKAGKQPRFCRKQPSRTTTPTVAWDNKEEWQIRGRGAGGLAKGALLLSFLLAALCSTVVPLASADHSVLELLSEGIDSGEIIETVHARRAPMIPISASLRL